MNDMQASDDTQMTRRSLLCGALVTVVAAASSTALMQQMQNYLPPGKVAKPRSARLS